MRLDWRLSWVAVASLTLAACNGVEPAPAKETVTSVEQGLGSLGSSCSSDSQCASGLCANLHTSQTYWPWCYGTICTVPCEGQQSGDAYCQQVAEEAGAPYPEGAYCTAFGFESYYACDLAAAGLGTVSCE